MSSLEHTLDALVEHVRLQGHRLRYYTAVERPFAVRLELTSPQKAGIQLLLEVRGSSRDDIIQQAQQLLEFVRGNLISSLIGPVVTLEDG